MGSCPSHSHRLGFSLCAPVKFVAFGFTTGLCFWNIVYGVVNGAKHGSLGVLSKTWKVKLEPNDSTRPHLVGAQLLGCDAWFWKALEVEEKWVIYFGIRVKPSWIGHCEKQDNALEVSQISRICMWRRVPSYGDSPHFFLALIPSHLTAASRCSFQNPTYYS